MLRGLRAAGLGVVDDVTIDFEPGLNVLTGETGAGKSMLVGALGLLLGGKGDAEAIRADADGGEVEGLFVCDEHATAELSALGVDTPEGEVVVSRRIRRGGSRAFVNGRLATTAVLSEVGALLVEVIGQYTARTLSQPGVQRRALDRYGAKTIDKAARLAAAAYDRRRDLEAELALLGGDPAERARACEVLAFQLGEIRSVEPEPGEDEVLAAELRRLSNVEALRHDAASAQQLSGEARDLLATAVSLMTRIADPALAEIGAGVSTSMAQIEDSLVDLRNFVESCQSDPERLEAVQGRISALKELTRKYGASVKAVLEFAADAEARLVELHGADARTRELAGELDSAAVALRGAAERLTAARSKAAPRLAAGVVARVRRLALAGARFEVAVSPLDGHGAAKSPERIERHGADDVRFLFSSNAKFDLRPVAKVASGGELSRLMLALAAELADLEAAPTIVFDEIDTGIGGETALAVGQALAELAQRRQLVCVTHLAQVAAFADHHVVLRRNGSTAVADVVRDVDRVVEVSRMLSGTPRSERAHLHALELSELADSMKQR